MEPPAPPDRLLAVVAVVALPLNAPLKVVAVNVPALKVKVVAEFKAPPVPA